MALEEAQPFIWGSGGSRLTPEQIDAQRKVARAMMEKGMDYSPIQHWTQGGARVSQALLGAMESREADAAAKTNAAADREMIASLISGGTPTASAGAAPTAPPVSASPSAVQIVPADQFNSIDAMADLKPETQAKLPVAQGAVSNIESGGRYDAIGPIITSGPMAGQRALGKYGVMESNVAPWTKRVMGRAMTPQEFVNNADAQDATFNGQFGGYMEKYGTAGATRAWHAGEGGMNKPQAQDQLGTKTSTYGRNVAAIVDGSALPPNAQPAGPATATPPVLAVAGSQAGPTPAVQTVAGPLAGVNPALAQALASPYASEGVKKIAGIILQNQLTAQGVTTVDLGNSVGVMDKHGNLIKSLPKGEPNKGPTFGVTGEDSSGNKTYGWINPRDLSVTPYSPPGGGAPATVTGPDGKQIVIPAGQDPKKFREHVTAATADAAVGKKTEVQAKDEKFANKMELAERNIGGGVEKRGTDKFHRATEYVPGGNFAQSDDYQKYKQARNNFITALLRDESGAAIGTEEFNRYEKELFPQPGDGQKVIEQKREARRVATEAMKKGAGPGYKSPVFDNAQNGSAPANVDPKIWAAMTPEERALWK